jgi:hypothetical protein
MADDDTDLLPIHRAETYKDGATYTMKLSLRDAEEQRTILDQWGISSMLPELAQSGRLEATTYGGLLFAVPHADYLGAFDADQLGGERVVPAINARDRAWGIPIAWCTNTPDDIDCPPETGFIVFLVLYPLVSGKRYVQAANSSLRKLHWAFNAVSASCLVEITISPDT